MHKSSILCGVITHTDEYLVTGSYNKVLNVIRIETGDVIHSVENHSEAITALCMSQDDAILLSGNIFQLFKTLN
jgi:WD40 repeat protein